jgi:hypothetical protein
MIIDPVSAVLGGGQAVMGIFQGIAGNKAAKQDFLNQQAFSNANATYARWQAGMSAKVSDTNNQFQYWQQTVNANQEKAYVNSLRNFELGKSIMQAEVVGQARASAGANYSQQAQALNQQISEKAMEDAVALQQYRMQSLKARASVQAMGQEGRGVDRLMADYSRQEGDYTTLRNISQGLYNRQIGRSQVAAVTNYLQAYNSQQFYTEQTFMDPIAPFAPLPTMIQPPPPSMAGGAPSSASAGLGIATGLLSGVNTYYNASSQFSKYRGTGGGYSAGTGYGSAPMTNNTKLAYSGINLLG